MSRFIQSDFKLHKGDESSHFVVERYQDIPQEFLDQLAEDRKESSTSRMKDFHKVASIPEVLVQKWLREGFDIYQADVKEILAKLRAESLDYFIATERRI